MDLDCHDVSRSRSARLHTSIARSRRRRSAASGWGQVRRQATEIERIASRFLVDTGGWLAAATEMVAVPPNASGPPHEFPVMSALWHGAPPPCPLTSAKLAAALSAWIPPCPCAIAWPSHDAKGGRGSARPRTPSTDRPSHALQQKREPMPAPVPQVLHTCLGF